MKEKQKDKDFVKFFRNYLDEVAKLARKQPTAYDLFMLLCKHMDGTNALCASMVALTEITGLSRQTLSKSVKYLKDNGWICILKSGTSNVYIVNPEVAWTSYGNQKSYCKFQANVLLSSSENAEYLKNSKATNHFKTIDTDFIKSVVDKQKEFEENCKTYT